MTQTLLAKIQLDFTVKKSLFRVHAAPITNEEDARCFFEHVRQPDATHNCWAWRLGDRYRSFDDGEPGGTAGRPILQAIDSQTFDRVAVLVVRWFGGIKLGAGGLVRAYGGSTASCLKQAKAAPIVPMQRIRFHASFGIIPIIQSRLGHWEATQESCHFDSEGAVITLFIPTALLSTISSNLKDLLRTEIIYYID